MTRPIFNQFAAEGHAAMPAAYDPALAEPALAEIQAAAWQRHKAARLGRAGLVTTLTWLWDTPAGSASRQLIDDLNAAAQTIGYSLEPDTRRGSFSQLIELAPGQNGQWHTDCPLLDDVTVVTTLRGRSWLQVRPVGGGEIVSHVLQPGAVAFVLGKQVKHRGVAEASGSRIGLAASRLIKQ